MKERKFTPPTEYPAEYANGLLVLAVTSSGYFLGEDPNGSVLTWKSNGENIVYEFNDLHDLPKRVVTYHNVYTDYVSEAFWSVEAATEDDNQDRLFMYEITRDEHTGENPTIEIVKDEE